MCHQHGKKRCALAKKFSMYIMHEHEIEKVELMHGKSDNFVIHIISRIKSPDQNEFIIPRLGFVPPGMSTTILESGNSKISIKNIKIYFSLFFF